jgi:ribonucleoside-diphosphate reductase alpha chain
VSQGIEPLTANLFSQKASKGTFIKKNRQLLGILQSKGLDTTEVWEQINKDRGSVKNVKQLSDEEKQVFLTAREINQYALVQQASQRQKYIDQAQSLNLFFSTPTNATEGKLVAKYINDVHLEAWRSGVKSLYYLKTESPLKGDTVFIDKEDGSCKACEG